MFGLDTLYTIQTALLDHIYIINLRLVDFPGDKKYGKSLADANAALDVVTTQLKNRLEAEKHEDHRESMERLNHWREISRIKRRGSG